MIQNNCICPICGKGFHLKPSHKAKGKNHYCSRECHYIAKRGYMRGERNHQYGLKGELNSSWKGGKTLSHYGYVLVNMPDHPFCNNQGRMLEHRLVAEQFL